MSEMCNSNSATNQLCPKSMFHQKKKKESCLINEGQYVEKLTNNQEGFSKCS